MILCRKCRQNPVNPGFPHCQKCYTAIKVKKITCVSCIVCNKNPANPGYSKCQTCFEACNTFTFPICLICNINPATYESSSIGYYRCDPCANIASIVHPVQGQPLCQICDRRAWFNIHSKKFAPGCCKAHSISANSKGAYYPR